MRILWALIFFVAFTAYAAPSREASEEDDVDDDGRKLSAEIAGKRTLKSTHGRYLRHVQHEINGVWTWTVDTAQLCLACEQWTIVDRQGKVALQPHCHEGGAPNVVPRRLPAGYLRAYADGSVRVATTDDEAALWTPVKREDGTWSFKGHHGGYLSAGKSTAVYTATDDIDEWENFRLGSWPGEAATPSQSHSATRGEDSASNEKSGESDGMSIEEFVEFLKRLQGAFRNIDEMRSEGKVASPHRGDNVASDSSVSTDEKAADEEVEEEPTDESEQEERSLYAEIAGKRTLMSHYNAYLRAWSNHSDWFVGTAPQPKECEQWYIEEHEGKVALKAYCSEQYLRSNEGNYVDLGDKPLAHEMWTPVKNEDGSWSFKGHHGTWLRAQPHGRVSLQTGLNGGDEKFWLGTWTEKFDELEGARSLKSTHGTFLRAAYCASDIDATNVDMAVHLKACEKWHIKLSGKKVSLMPIAEPGKYLRAYSDGSVGLSKKLEEVGVRELWTPLKHADGSWSLKSAHGKLLSAATNGTVTTVVDNMAEENFWIKEIEE